MATITLKSIPDELYARLRKAAELHRRSINREVIVCIEMALATKRASAADVLARARRVRRTFAGKPLDVAELIKAKSSGRP